MNITFLFWNIKVLLMSATKKDLHIKSSKALNILKKIRQGFDLLQPPKIEPRTKTGNPAGKGRKQIQEHTCNNNTKVIHDLSITHLVAEIGLFLWIWRFCKITVANLMSLSHSLKTLTPIKERCQFLSAYNKYLTLLEAKPRSGLLTWTFASAMLPNVFEPWNVLPMSPDFIWKVLFSSLPWEEAYCLGAWSRMIFCPSESLLWQTCYFATPYLQFVNNRRKTDFAVSVKKSQFRDSQHKKKNT